MFKKTLHGPEFMNSLQQWEEISGNNGLPRRKTALTAILHQVKKLQNTINFCNLWSIVYVVNGQSSWQQIQRFRVRFPALPDFLRSSGSGMGSIQHREYN
jgi:hypothetical protein